MATEIDPIEYGRLIEQVGNMKTEIDELRGDVKKLLELANQSKGGFWAGMAIASGLGGAITWLVTLLAHRPQ